MRRILLLAGLILMTTSAWGQSTSGASSYFGPLSSGTTGASSDWPPSCEWNIASRRECRAALQPKQPTKVRKVRYR
jgi:hypothetical protein